MPINVGEVEAVLTARDQMSPTFVAAAERVQQLRTILAGLGDDAGPQLEKVTRALAEAEIAFEDFRDAGNTAKESIDQIGPAAGTSAAKLADLEASTRKATEAMNQADPAAAARAQRARDAAIAIGQETAAIDLQTNSIKNWQSASQSQAAAAAGFSPVAGSPLPAPIAGRIGGNADAAPSLANQLALGLGKDTPALADAEAQVKSISAQIVMLGKTSGDEFDELAGELRSAEGNFKTLQRAVSNTSDSMEQGKIATNGYSQSMSSMEGIATRLIERMILMYAIRASAEFVVGLFEAADAMVQLSDRTGLSVTKLQELEYGAEQTSLPLGTLTTAVDSLDKKLAMAKMSTSDALQSIGLSFSQVFAMSPDQRFDAVGAAIGGIEDPVKRTRAEIELFGTDAIDPLIKRLKDLEDQAPKTSEANIHAMSNTIQMYRVGLSDLKTIVSQIIDSGQQGVQDAIAPLLGGKTSGSYESLALSAMLPFGLGGSIINQVPIPEPTTTPNNILQYGTGTGASNKPTGPDFIDTLRSQASGTKELTDEQRKQLDVLKELNLLTADNAAQLTHDGVNLDINTEQFKKYQASIKGAGAALRDLAQVAKDNATAEYDTQKADIDSSQTGFEKEFSIIEALHAEKVAIIGSEKATTAKRNADLEAEDSRYYLSEQDAETKQAAAIQAIQDRSALAIEAAHNQGNQKSLQGTLDSLDQQEQAAEASNIRLIGYTDQLWIAQYATFLEFQAKKQSATDQYDTTQLGKVQKLQADIAGLENATGQTSLGQKIALDNAKEQEDISALGRSKIEMLDYFEQLGLIQQRSQDQRIKDTADFQRKQDQIIQDAVAEDQTVILGLYQTGVDQQLALNELKRTKALDLLHKQGQDTTEALAAEKQLYDDHARAIIASFDPIHTAWLGLQTDMRQELAGTWSSMFEGNGSLVDTFVKSLNQIEDPWKKLLGAMVADFESDFLSKMFGIGSGGGASIFSAIVTDTDTGNKTQTGSVSSGKSSVGSNGAVGAISAISTLAEGGSPVQAMISVGETAVAVAAQVAIAQGAITGAALAAGAATLGVGAAAVIAYVAIKDMFSLDPGYVAAKEAQADLIKQLQGIATAAEKTQGALTDNFHTIQIVAGDAARNIGLSFEQADKLVQGLLDTANPGNFQAAEGELATILKLEGQISDGVDGVSTAFGNAGEYIPKALRDSLSALEKMPGLTDAERLAIDKLVQSATPKYKDLSDIMDKYGIDIDKLGIKFQQLSVEDATHTIFSDFTELTDAGADANGVIDGMQKAIQGVVTKSIQFGTSIPDNMKPLIQHLIDTGQLLDDNGNKITDISKLSFENTPLDAALTGLQGAIDNLNTILSNALSTLKNIFVLNPDIVSNFQGSPTAGGGNTGGAAGGSTGGSNSAPGNPAPGPNQGSGEGSPNSGASSGSITTGPGGAIRRFTPAATGGLIVDGGILPHMATGGMVGGKVLNFPSQSVDNQPIMAAIGEGVVNHTGMGVLGQGGLDKLNSGAKPGGDMYVNISASITVHAMDGASTAKVVASPEFQNELVRQMAMTQSGLAAKMKRTLRIKAA